MRFLSDIMGTRFTGPIDFRPLLQMRCAFDTLGLELISPSSPDDPSSLINFGPILEEEGEGFLALGLKVTDVDEAVAELKAKGIRILSHVKSPEAPVRNIAITYPDVYGIRLELLEYDGPQPIAVANLIAAGQLGNLPWFKA